MSVLSVSVSSSHCRWWLEDGTFSPAFKIRSNACLGMGLSSNWRMLLRLFTAS